MAWLVFGIMIWGVLMLLIGPLLGRRGAAPDNKPEIDAYTLEIEALSREIESSSNPDLKARKLALQRQLLELTKTPDSDAALPLRTILTLCVFFVFGGLALYHTLGRPELAHKDALTAMAPAAGNAETIPLDETATSDELLRLLKAKLDGDHSEDPQGWFLYARSLMSTGRFVEAFEAYEQVLRLTNNDQSVQEEYERAKAYAQNGASRGPSADDISSAAALTPKERSAMIENMVTGLAAKLRENPENTEGWIKLLRSRKVLEQINEGKEDVTVLSAHYADRPDVIANILQQSGWTNK